MKTLIICLFFFFGGMVLCSAQSSAIQLKVISGNKLLFTGESGKLESLFREHFLIRKRELQDRIFETIGQHMKIRTNQGLRDLGVSFGYPVFSVSQVNNTVMLLITIPHNEVSFNITTRDFAGIGKDRSEDPFISFKYTILATLPLSQKGDAESIEFESPYWAFEVQQNNSRKLESLDWASYINDDIRNMAGRVKEQYMLLNEVKDKFNYYLNEEIIENKNLQKELQIDENEILDVSAAGDQTLVFKHEYSSAGILKRSTGTDASVITEKPATSPTVPNSTNPNDSKKPLSTNQPSTLPANNKPSDVKKGPSSIPKSDPVPKKYQ